MSPAPAIAVEHLRKVYGSGRTEVVAVRDASLEIARGEIVGLLGPSGSGKSTLLTAMALINPPTSGRIAINGEPVLVALIGGAVADELMARSDQYIVDDAVAALGAMYP